MLSSARVLTSAQSFAKHLGQDAVNAACQVPGGRHRHAGGRDTLPDGRSASSLFGLQANYSSSGRYLANELLRVQGDARRAQGQDFYQNTVKAMGEKHAASKQTTSQDTDGEIQHLLQKAKDAAEEIKTATTKFPPPKVPGEKSVAGRKKYPTEKEEEQEPVREEEDDEIAEVKEE